MEEMERYPATGPSLADVCKRLDAVEKALKAQCVRYSWEDQQADGGIQLVGSATVTRKGTMLTAVPIPTGPNQMTVAFVLREDTSGKLALVPLENVKPLE